MQWIRGPKVFEPVDRLRVRLASPESTPPPVSPPDTIRIRLKEAAVTDDSSAFIGVREFARVLLGAPTIYLALPLVCAHWAIVRGWAEPHYLRSFGLMPAGAVVVYTPPDQDICLLFSIFRRLPFCVQVKYTK